MSRRLPALQPLFAELERSGQAHDAGTANRAEKLLNLERPTAELLHLLVRATHRRRFLEIGTSNGYSTLWLAVALEEVRNAAPEPARRADVPTLVSIERDSAKLAQARQNLTRAGLADHVELRQGDATEVVADLAGPFDGVFFDADRVSAPEQLRRLLPKLTPDVLLVADNALSHPAELAGYLAALAGRPEFFVTLVPVGKGLHVAHRTGFAPSGDPPAVLPSR